MLSSRTVQVSSKYKLGGKAVKLTFSWSLFPEGQEFSSTVKMYGLYYLVYIKDNISFSVFVGWNIFRGIASKNIFPQKKVVWLNLPIQCIDLSVESTATACYLHIWRKLWYSVPVYFENENVIAMWKCIWKKPENASGKVPKILV